MRRSARMIVIAGAAVTVLGVVPGAGATNHDDPTPNVEECLPSGSNPDVPETGGDGMAAIVFTDSTATFECSYTASKDATANFYASSLNAWAITVDGVQVAHQDNVVDGGGAEVSGSFDVAVDDVVTLSVTPGCADDNCGSAGEWLVGSS